MGANIELEDILGLSCKDFFLYIKTIPYGYRDTAGGRHVFAAGAPHTVERYAFSSPGEVVRNNCGRCWDVTNLIKCYCAHNGLEWKCYFLEYRAPALHKTHTQVFLRYRGRWYAAPDNTAADGIARRGYAEPEACVDHFADGFTDSLRRMLGPAFDPARLLVKEFGREVPAGISEQEYLALARA